MTTARTPDPGTYRPAVLYAEWNNRTYPGEMMARYRWNGWAVPRFPRDVAELIVRDQAEMVRENPENPSLYWDGETVVMVDPHYPDEPERFTPDDDGMYDIGAMNWIWQEWTP